MEDQEWMGSLKSVAVGCYSPHQWGQSPSTPVDSDLPPVTSLQPQHLSPVMTGTKATVKRHIYHPPRGSPLTA